MRAHWPALVAADFFTTEVWTGRGPVTYYTVFVLELHSRRVRKGGATRSPDEAFVLQAVSELTDSMDGVMVPGKILLCDRDPKWSSAVEAFLHHEVFGSSALRSSPLNTTSGASAVARRSRHAMTTLARKTAECRWRQLCR